MHGLPPLADARRGRLCPSFCLRRAAGRILAAPSKLESSAPLLPALHRHEEAAPPAPCVAAGRSSTSGSPRCRREAALRQLATAPKSHADAPRGSVAAAPRLRSCRHIRRFGGEQGRRPLTETARGAAQLVGRLQPRSLSCRRRRRTETSAATALWAPLPRPSCRMTRGCCTPSLSIWADHVKVDLVLSYAYLYATSRFPRSVVATATSPLTGAAGHGPAVVARERGGRGRSGPAGPRLDAKVVGPDPMLYLTMTPGPTRSRWWYLLGHYGGDGR